MKEKKEEIINFIKRTLSNEALSVRIYIVWGILTLLVFGIFGLYPVSKIFVSNVKLLDDLYTNNLKLEKKIEDLKSAKEKVDIVGEDADILDNFLPDEFLAQNYLVDFSLLAGEAGYALDGVKFEEVEGSEVVVSLNLSGKGDLKYFVKSLEESRRLNEIIDIKYSVRDRENSINIGVNPFFVGEK